MKVTPFRLQIFAAWKTILFAPYVIKVNLQITYYKFLSATLDAYSHNPYIKW